MTFPAADIQTLTPGTVVELFELDATGLGGVVNRFHPGVAPGGSDVVWQGNTYYRMPIQGSGWAMSSKGALPRPKVRVSALGGAIGSLVRSYDDLVGAKFTRKRTLLKYLDGCNFPAKTATNEAFTPSGTSGQLYIGDMQVVANAAISSLVRTDWQGTVALSTSARTNLCPESGSVGGSQWTNLSRLTLGTSITAPDGSGAMSLLVGVSGTVTYTRSASMAVTASTSIPFSMYLKAGTSAQSKYSFYDGSVANLLGYAIVNWSSSVPSIDSSSGLTGATLLGIGNGVYKLYGTVSSKTYTSARILIYPDNLVLGNTSYAWGVMFGAVGSYIPTTTAPVTLTDYSYTPSGLVTLGQSASGTYVWSGSGSGNVTSDPSVQSPDDVFFVERKTYEGPDYLEFELVSALDLEGLQLPSRKVIKGVCPWFDASICPHSVTGCLKSRAACEAAWGLHQPLPFGGYLGVTTT